MLNIFKRKAGPTFNVIRPHTEEALPMGFFWVQAGEKKTLGFRCTSFYAYQVRETVNDGKQIVHLADWLNANNYKTADELPTVVLTLQKADATQQNIGGQNIIETDSLDDFDGEFKYEQEGVRWV